MASSFAPKTERATQRFLATTGHRPEQEVLGKQVASDAIAVAKATDEHRRRPRDDPHPDAWGCGSLPVC